MVFVPSVMVMLLTVAPVSTLPVKVILVASSAFNSSSPPSLKAIVLTPSPVVGAVVSIITLPSVLPLFPALLVAITVTAVLSSLRSETTLSINVQVPSPLLVATYSTSLIITITTAFGSSTVPVSCGVVSLVIKSLKVTVGTTSSSPVGIMAL